MAFHLGSLGFLTPFKFDNFQEQVDSVLEGECGATDNGHYFLQLHFFFISVLRRKPNILMNELTFYVLKAHLCEENVKYAS